MTARKYKDPFGRLFYNMQRSARSGPKGSGQKILDPDYKPRKIDMTVEDLKDIWYNKQRGKCYWLGITLDPDWVNVSWHPLALSIDRLECGGDYVKDNIVICSRLANAGRSKYDKDKFRDVVGYIKTEVMGET